MGLWYAGLVGILFMLTFRVLSLAIGVETKASRKMYQNTKVRKEKKVNPAYIFARYIVIPEYKRQTMQNSINNLGINMTVEQYYSECIYKALPFLALGAAIFASGLFPEAAAATVCYGGYTLYRESGKLKRALDYKRIKVEEEAPNMIRFFIVSLKNTNDLQKIFENYAVNAGYLKQDIELCLLDMKSIRSDENNMVYALERFAERLDTPVMTDFVSGLINALAGKDQENYFLLLERDLKELSINNLYRKNAKVQGSVRNKFFVLIFDYLYITFAIIGMFVANGLK